MKNPLSGLTPEIHNTILHACLEMENLTQKWQIYLDLFGEEESRQLLGKTADLTFNAIEESLRVDITMTICRLADPGRSKSGDNLSFDLLEEYLASDAEFVAESRVFHSACKPLQKIRNKLLGHNDLKTRIEPEKNQLAGSCRSDIEQIIASGTKSLKHLSRRYLGGELEFNNPPHVGGEDLLYWLQKGWEAENGPWSA